MSSHFLHDIITALHNIRIIGFWI